VQDRSTSYILGLTLVLLGTIALSSCIMAVFFPEAESFPVILVSIPGAFLFKSFHAAAFFVPVYLFVTAGLVFQPKIDKESLVVLNFSVVPFLTFSVFLRLVFDASLDASPVTSGVIHAFTRPGGAVLFFLFTAAGLLGLSQAGRLVKGRDWSTAEEKRRPGRAYRNSPREVRKIAALIEHHRASAAQDVFRPERAATPSQGEGASGERFVTPPAGFRADLPDDVPQEYEVLEVAEEEPWDSARNADSLDRQEGGIGQQDGLEERKRPVEEPEVYEGYFSIEDAETEAEEELEEQDDALDLDDSPDADKSYEEEPLSVFFTRGTFRDVTPAAPESPPSGLQKSPDKSGARRNSKKKTYSVPVKGLLDEYADGEYWEIDEETKHSAEVLRVTLEEFQIQAEVTGIRKGPVITMFEILPAPGVKLTKITNLADNIALRLAASSVRIVAPIPGKHAVGIEIPNKNRHLVSFAELVQEKSFQNEKKEIPIALGKDIPGDAQLIDLTKTPHLLIAGATGSGKSVCVNSIICSVLYRKSPQQVKMILIDPKIVELKFYNDIPHLLTPVITDPKRAFQALQYCIYEMERRYSLLDALAVRDVRSYNAKIQKRDLATEPLPYIVVVIDEFADLMATTGKELESTLARLAAMSRAVGIHLVLATQRPSTDVITGLIKANIPSRIAFMVSSKVDSRIILDSMGAEKLLGQGDMLFTSAWDPFPVRVQGAYLSEEEVERVVEYVKTLGEPDYIDDEIFVDDDENYDLQAELEDPLMEKAIDIVVSANKASASYLQRRLKIGYNRAARLVEEMERIGIVGPQNGSKPRDVIGAPD